MSEQILLNVNAYAGRVNLTTLSNAIAAEVSVDTEDNTRFTQETRRMAALMKTANIEASGFWDSDADPHIYNAVGGAAVPVTVVPAIGAEGEVAYFANMLILNYQPFSGSNKERGKYSLSAEMGDSPFIRGRLALKGVKTTTEQSAAYQLGALADTQTLGAAAHVFSASGTTPTLDLTVESAPTSGFSSPTTRLTMSQLTDAGSVFDSITDTEITDEYWRVVATIGGTNPSFNLAVAIGIGG